MKKSETVITILLFVLLLALAVTNRNLRKHGGKTVSDTVKVEVTDTIRYYHPVPKDSVVLRYVTRTLAPGASSKPQSSESGAGQTESGAGQTPDGTDSVDVEIPITQKKYETSEYRAYVSGYEPCLDSIFVFQKTITETVTVRSNGKPKVCFGIAVGPGYGIFSRKADLFAGLAVTVTF